MHDLEQLIPLAAGIIISPLPIAAIIAILLSPRARVNGFAYVGASVLVSFAFTVVAALTTTGAGAGGSANDDVIVLVLGILLSVGFLGLAIASWLTRPKSGAAVAPGWLRAIDDMSAAKTFGLGAVMAVTNAKNIPLELKAGALIGAADLGIALAVLLSAVFALAASLGILLPTLLASTGSRAIESGLARLKAELIAHNAIIMTVLFAILAAVQISHVVAALAR
ncbi:GAP family protein [Leifsonia aquatica]|uniref:GAP family protein n=1 Tax=Leifsonia aquatica TaxID=144185 RepID=UPI0004691012|nr:GAP family protein [Leifsonia aquatica]